MKSFGTIKLETDRFILRRFCVADAKDMFSNYASNHNVTKYLSWKAHESIKESETLIKIWEEEYNSNDFYQWAIVSKDEDKVIGGISIVNIWKEFEKVEVGYCIGEEYWHKGIATEVLKKIIEFIFESLLVKTVIGRCDVNNIYSGRVMEKCGMIYQCTIKNACKNNKGEYVDCAYYSLEKIENI